MQQIERATLGSVTYYRDFRVTVEEVFRFDPEDTLVLRLRFENTGESEVVYPNVYAEDVIKGTRGTASYHPAWEKYCSTAALGGEP